MPQVHIILEDDNANTTQQTFALTGDLDTLDGMDEAVEQLRLDALPQLEKTRLQQAQERVVQQEKKTLVAS